MKYPKVKYWLKGKRIQNFGDYLSLLFLRDLFYPTDVNAVSMRLVGSVLDDHVIPLDTKWSMFKASPHAPVVFWACGVRKPGGLNDENRKVSRILGVRGPLSIEDLKLDASTPMGDPGLLIPFLYEPRKVPELQGKTICLPHFHDLRTNDELVNISGCDQVLRPNIPNHPRHLYRTIDAIRAADFVLTASLHGAIIALAYGRPFAYWSNGLLDLPFKWEDFAASVSITKKFATNLEEGRVLYQRGISSQAKIPSLLPILSIAPFPIRLRPLLKVILKELSLDPAATNMDSRDVQDRISALRQENPTVDKMLIASEQAAITFKDQSRFRWRSGTNAASRKSFFLFYQLGRRCRSPLSFRKIYKFTKLNLAAKA
jgi:hypothetical protein